MNEIRNKLISSIESFKDGSQRGKNFAKEIEALVLELDEKLDESDTTFDNLIDALSMFGAGNSVSLDEDMLIKVFNHALAKL